MKRIRTIVTGCVALAVTAMLPASARAQSTSGLSGVWTLNRAVSEFPADIGFNPAWMTAPLAGSSSGDSSRGGRGGRGGRRGGGHRQRRGPVFPPPRGEHHTRAPPPLAPPKTH